jgi:hypothetical protein
MIVVLISIGGLMCLACACLVPYLLIRPADDDGMQEYGQLDQDQGDDEDGALDGVYDDDEYDDASDCDVEMVERSLLDQSGVGESAELEQQQGGSEDEQQVVAVQDEYCWDSERGLVKADSDSDS